MKKSIFPFLILAALLSGCGSDEPASEYSEGEIKFREAYAEGFKDGLWALQTKYSEEIRPEYNWLLENYLFFENNFCVVSPDRTYHIYYDCYDGEGQKLMFLEDAKASGYEKCFYCYDNYPSMNHLPSYDDIVRGHKPDYPAYNED